MKLVITTHFTRMQHIDEFSTVQCNSSHKRYHEKDAHSVDKLTFSWENYIQNNKYKLRENMPTYIEK